MYSFQFSKRKKETTTNQWGRTKEAGSKTFPPCLWLCVLMWHERAQNPRRISFHKWHCPPCCAFLPTKTSDFLNPFFVIPSVTFTAANSCFWCQHCWPGKVPVQLRQPNKIRDITLHYLRAQIWASLKQYVLVGNLIIPAAISFSLFNASSPSPFCLLSPGNAMAHSWVMEAGRALSRLRGFLNPSQAEQSTHQKY